MKKNPLSKKLILVTAGATILAGCGTIPANDKPTVSATIFPVYSLVEQVAGDQLSVELILPTGASPHSFAPEPSDVQTITDSDLVFSIGHGLDSWVIELIESAEPQTPQLVTLDDQIELLASDDHDHSHDSDAHTENEHAAEDDDHADEEHAETADHTDEDEHAEDDHAQVEQAENADPHYWLSVVNAQLMVAQISAELQAAYPEFADEFQANEAALLADLANLNSELNDQLSQPGSDPIAIATFHNAWSYLARDHQLNIVTTFEEFPGEQPSPTYLQEFSDQVEAYNVTAVFSEPQFSTTALEPIARDLDLQIGQLDPIGGTADTDTYQNLMRYNVSQILASQE